MCRQYGVSELEALGFGPLPHLLERCAEEWELLQQQQGGGGQQRVVPLHALCLQPAGGRVCVAVHSYLPELHMCAFTMTCRLSHCLPAVPLAVGVATACLPAIHHSVLRAPTNPRQSCLVCPRWHLSGNEVSSSFTVSGVCPPCRPLCEQQGQQQQGAGCGRPAHCPSLGGAAPAHCMA